MSAILAILKLVGVLITGASGVWALIVDANSQAKHRARKHLLALGVAGLVVALSAQVLDSWKSKRDDDENKARTRNLLAEIERAVTRIDYVSMDASVAWPLNEPPLSKYRDRIQRLIGDAETESPKTGEESHGLRVVTRSQDHISIFGVPADSDALPQRSDGTAFEFFRAAAHPHVSIYKQPPDEKILNSFVESGLASLPPADFKLIPRGGTREIFVVPFEGLQSSSFAIQDKAVSLEVPKETWSQNGNVISTADIAGTTAIISISSTVDVQRLWKASSIDLYFNGQKTHIDPKQLREFSGHWATIYVFTFPKVNSTD